MQSGSNSAQGVVGSGGSRAARAAATKRARTRKSVLEALGELLPTVDYDDLRVADIAEHAAIGMATFYNVCGSKAIAVSELFQSVYEPIQRHTAVQLESLMAEKATEPVNYLELLRDHLQRLAALVCESPHNRRISRAFLRAYGSETFAVTDGSDDLIAPVSLLPRQLLERAVALDPLQNEALMIKNLGEMMTVDVIITALNHGVESSTTATDRLIDLYVPKT